MVTMMEGNLYKRRGGFGKFDSESWILRHFCLSETGELNYYELNKSKPRGSIFLRRQEVYIKKDFNENKSGAPYPYLIVIQTYGDIQQQQHHQADSDSELPPSPSHQSKPLLLDPNLAECHPSHGPTSKQTLLMPMSSSPIRRNQSGDAVETLFGRHHKQRWIIACSTNEEQEQWYRALQPYISHVKKSELKQQQQQQEQRKRKNRSKSLDGGTLQELQFALADRLDHPPYVRQQEQQQINPSVIANTSDAKADLSYFFCFLLINASAAYLWFGPSIMEINKQIMKDGEYKKLIVFLCLNYVCGFMSRLRFASKSNKLKRSTLKKKVSSKKMATRAHSKVTILKELKKGVPIPAGSTFPRGTTSDSSLLEIQKESDGKVSKQLIRSISQSCNDSQILCTLPSPHSYWNTDPSIVKLRIGPNYKKLKQKAPSKPALFDLVAMDLFQADFAVQQIGDVVEIPRIEGLTIGVNTGHDHIPPLFVVNALIPLEAASMMRPATDGPTIMAVMYFAITESTLEQLKDLSSASAGVKLLSEFCKRGEKESDFRSRFKCFAYVDDLRRSPIPSMLHPYNGKPALITKSGSLTRFYDSNKNDDNDNGLHYLEMTTDIRQWGYVARKGLNTLLPYFPLVTIDFGFTIEGRSDEELPEVLLGACRLMNIDPNEAPYYDNSS